MKERQACRAYRKDIEQKTGGKRSFVYLIP
jgi:hypothetical protein